MTEISTQAASARESARQSDGRFGTQSHSEPDGLTPAMTPDEMDRRLDADGHEWFEKCRSDDPVVASRAESLWRETAFAVLCAKVKDEHPSAHAIQLESWGGSSSGYFISSITDAKGHRLATGEETDEGVDDAFEIPGSAVETVRESEGMLGDARYAKTWTESHRTHGYHSYEVAEIIVNEPVFWTPNEV